MLSVRGKRKTAPGDSRQDLMHEMTESDVSSTTAGSSSQHTECEDTISEIMLQKDEEQPRSRPPSGKESRPGSAKALTPV